MKLKLTIFFSTVLTSVLSAPYPVPQNAPGPFAAIGSLIQRLQSSFYEGSASLRQQPPFPLAKAVTEGNETVVRLSLPSSVSTPSSIITTITTSTTTTTTQRPVTNGFDSINAILDNISRGNINNNNLDNNNNNNINNNNNNNLFGNPQRSLFDLFTTTTTPAPTTTRSPFDLDGVGQGINAFLQAFIKTNIQKLFRPGQDQQQSLQNEVKTRSDPPPSFGDIILNTFFRKPQ